MMETRSAGTQDQYLQGCLDTSLLVCERDKITLQRGKTQNVSKKVNIGPKNMVEFKVVLITHELIYVLPFAFPSSTSVPM